MGRSLQLCTLVLGLVFCLSALADDKDKKGSKNQDEKDRKEKLVPAGTVTGLLSQVEGAQKYFKVQISIPTVELAGQQPVQIPVRGQLVTYYIPQYRLRNITKDVELEATDEMKVRTLVLPLDFDEKGRPKKYTAKELKEMKGPDTALPGYSADFDSLKKDQYVKVYLARTKDSPPMPKPRAKPKKKGADDDAEVTTPQKPLVTMVVILSEPKK